MKLLIMFILSWLVVIFEPWLVGHFYSKFSPLFSDSDNLEKWYFGLMITLFFILMSGLILYFNMLILK